MTKWIIGLVLLIIVATGGWLYRDSIGGFLKGHNTPAPTQEEADPYAGWNMYASSTMGVSIKYPAGYALNAAYTNTSVNSKKPIAGVSFTIPGSMATGTNLSSGTYIAVEQLPRANNCTGDIFIAANVVARETIDGGFTYSVATSSGAAVGNRYEEVVYALAGSKPCTAVRYFVHSTNVDSYPAGSVREFDRAALIGAFDQIRRTLELTNTAAPAATP